MCHAAAGPVASKLAAEMNFFLPPPSKLASGCSLAAPASLPGRISGSPLPERVARQPSPGCRVFLFVPRRSLPRVGAVALHADIGAIPALTLEGTFFLACYPRW